MSNHPPDRIATVEVASRILAQGELVESDATGRAIVALGDSTRAEGVLIPSLRGRTRDGNEKN